MAASSSSSGKVVSNSDNSSSNNSPHLAFTTISNIKLHIPVQLSLFEPNYKKWSRLFRLLILRFNLKGFIDGTTIASSADDAEWYQFDALIQGWILSTITDEVSDLVLANNLTAHALWTAIYTLFHDNKHARAMQLEHRFRTTVKGNRSINDYCRLLKNLSEYLDDVDAPVTEHALVLQPYSSSNSSSRTLSTTPERGPLPFSALAVAAAMEQAHSSTDGRRTDAATVDKAGLRAAAVAVATAAGAAVEDVAAADSIGNHHRDKLLDNSPPPNPVC
ncbi:unnamed protein product [Cuscuta campestris]|uniref:Retrotransposon Copia-like N-terminal domain-containing protein n=1 Tax=Cuscuta campestris TaxID=132261 RepID=A0A484KF76_9ASTE|nr:unnamed protein product [Cuscuta campestris]